MKCARCSAEIPRQSQFCLRCGTPVSATVLPNTVGGAGLPLAAPPAANKKLIAVIAVLALAVAGLVGAVISGRLVQKAGRSDTGQLVQAPGQSGPGTLVQAPGATAPGPMVQAPADTHPPVMVQEPGNTPNTAEIDDYLKFVRQIELGKQKLYRDQMGDIPDMMGKATSMRATIEPDELQKASTDLHTDVDKMSTDWNQISMTFRQRTPPAECIDLRNKYLDHLAKMQAQITTVMAVLGNLGGDLTAAAHSVNKMDTHEADRAAQAADDALADVCRKYHLSKDFTIQIDSSSGGSLLGP